MKTLIVVNFQISGLHYWEDAKTVQPEVAFLSYPHMHKFHFQVKKQTTNDDDRNIEIILFEKELVDYFRRNFWDESLQTHMFHNKSCESIAADLMEAYDLDYVQVLEDGYWGAEVCK